MKDLLKGAVVTVIILVASIAISMFCNMRGIHLDIAYTGPMLAICAMLIYRGLTKKDKNKDNQE